MIRPAPAQDTTTAIATDAEIVGNWLGTLEADGERVRVVFKISKDAAGKLVGTMDSPDRRRRDLAITKTDWQDGQLRVEVVGDRVFTGSLDDTRAQLVGEWQQSGGTLPLRMARVDRVPSFEAATAAGLYVAAAIATVLSLLLIGRFVLVATPGTDWRFLMLIMVVHVPMWSIAFYWVRVPLKALLAGTLGAESRAFAILDTCMAPLTEELAKLWLLLVPWFVCRLRKENAPGIAMAIGLGFGIGEAWSTAEFASHDPQLGHIPWDSFMSLGGFIIERLMVCVHHGASTAAALRLFPQAPLRGILCAMGLHYLGNFPVALMAWNVGSLSESVWSQLMSVWLLLFFLSMVALLNHFFKTADPAGWRGLRHHFLGLAKCPECDLVYERPLFAVNCGIRRYERCPGCRRWHCTTAWKP